MGDFRRRIETPSVAPPIPTSDHQSYHKHALNFISAYIDDDS